jgi:hypothetical protein
MEGEMTARHLFYGLCFMICSVLATPVLVLAQGAPLTVGPLTVTLPPGWSGQTNGDPIRIFSPDSTPQQYLAVEFFLEQTTQDVRERHNTVIRNLAGMMPPGSVPQNGVLGKFIWTKIGMQRSPGQVETLVWYSAKSGPVYVGISVDATRADLLARHLPALETMLRGATLNGASAVPGSSNTLGPAGNASASAPAAVGLATLDEYVYTTPPGWAAQRLTDAIMISSPLSATNEKCLIYLLPMRPAGANLLVDANNAFRDVWLRNYVLRNQTPAGFAMPESIVHGTSGAGWDYVIVRRGIAPSNSPESRLGFVMVAKLDNRLAVISGLSKDPLVSACMGELTGATNWPKFFYSLNFKSWQAGDQTQAMRRRLAGVWTVATAGAADQITFAGNGRFANAAAAQQYHLSSTELITTTQAYFGNGSYTLRGNSITLTQDDKRSEHGFFRLEQESKDEGRTWADVFYLMRTSAVNGEEYELRYGKPH